MYDNKWIWAGLNCINLPPRGAFCPTVAELKYRKDILQANEVRGEA